MRRLPLAAAGLLLVVLAGCRTDASATVADDVRPIEPAPSSADRINRAKLARLAGGEVSSTTAGAWRSRTTAACHGCLTSGGGGGEGIGGGFAAAAPGPVSLLKSRIMITESSRPSSPPTASPPVVTPEPPPEPAPPPRATLAEPPDAYGDERPVADAEDAPVARSLRSRLDLSGALAQRPSQLRAGATDDNEKFDDFLNYMSALVTPTPPDGSMKIDVSARRFIKVVDADNRPIPTVELTIRDAKTERAVATAATYGDGRAPFYPRVSLGQQHQAGALLVQAELNGKAVAATWRNLEQDFVIKLDVDSRDRAADAMPIDVLFIIDTTGSMGDEIAQIKSSLLGVTAAVRQLRALDLRYGAVLYRDVGDQYVTSTHGFTSDIKAFDEALQSVNAAGGGDTPESLNQGLSEGMLGVDWRPRAAKVAFLIADAPPHMDYEDDVSYGESLKDAVTLGVRVHSVAASGLSDTPSGSLVFRQIAQYARGKFIFIEYGGDVAASGAAHGVSGVEKKSNNLDDILFAEIKNEVDAWGR